MGVPMRRVLRNTDEVMHYWANRVQDEGRAGNVSFDGAELFSYRACIGRRLGSAVVLSNRKWSVTTSSHQTSLRIS